MYEDRAMIDQALAAAPFDAADIDPAWLAEYAELADAELAQHPLDDDQLDGITKLAGEEREQLMAMRYMAAMHSFKSPETLECLDRAIANASGFDRLPRLVRELASRLETTGLSAALNLVENLDYDPVIRQEEARCERVIRPRMYADRAAGRMRQHRHEMAFGGANVAVNVWTPVESTGGIALAAPQRTVTLARGAGRPAARAGGGRATRAGPSDESDLEGEPAPAWRRLCATLGWHGRRW